MSSESNKGMSETEQAVFELLALKGCMERTQLAESLFGRDHDQSDPTLDGCLERMQQQGQISVLEDRVQLNSLKHQRMHQRTGAFLHWLKGLRSQDQPLCISTLLQQKDFSAWSEPLLKIWSHSTSTILDFLLPLDQDPARFQELLKAWELDLRQVNESGWVFTPMHLLSLKTAFHQKITDQLNAQGLNQQEFLRQVNAHYQQQSPVKVLMGMLEPSCLLQDAAVEELVLPFKSPYLKKTARVHLKAWQQQAKAFRGRFQARFGEEFTGTWRFDQVYYDLWQSGLKLLREHEFPDDETGWQHTLRQKSRERFQKAQSEEGGSQKAGGKQDASGFGFARPEWFQELGINPEATEAQVKEAYRKLAKTHHPDQGGEAARFQRMHQAYVKIMETFKHE